MNGDSNPAKAIFLEAVERHTPDQWPVFLDRACAGEPELRGQVEVLLGAHREVGTAQHRERAESADTGPVATIDLPPAAERPGTMIGPYKLLQQIGEGGMGSVWMTQQTEPVKRLVALKLIKPGMDSKQVIARFEAERQALALMDHPNIAKILDGGTTSTGRPYFVMDLVKGVPITTYCDEHHLTPRQRLKLFLPVCQAVQHAHQKGIIHRDLKPANVLVAQYDGEPVSKVIDFGVAKAAGQALTEQTLVTGFGAIIGTLEYMSPEQAEINQLDIDTRSDIYSLGVLLYELLTGSPPFTRKELEKVGILEMLRIIREQEPLKPSSRIKAEGGRMKEESKTTSRMWALFRHPFSSLIFPPSSFQELDWIVMKALEKDRNRRYETANAFAMDVQRYLADEAVQAGPPSAGYRLRKFLRRNKTGLAVAAILLGLVIAYSGVLYGQNRELTTSLHFREQAEKSADIKAREALASAATAAAREADAVAARKDLEAQKQIADEAADRATKQRDEARAHLFTGQLMRVATVYERDPKRGLELLHEYDACPIELRDSTWRYYENACRGRKPSVLIPALEKESLQSYAALSPDRKTLAWGGDDWAVRLWDVTTGEGRGVLTGHAAKVAAVAFSPDGKTLASGSNDSTVRLWDVAAGRELAVLREENRYAVMAVAFSPDGRVLATGGSDKKVRVWEIETGRLMATITGHTHSVESVVFSPDGKTLVSCGRDVRLWDVATGQARADFPMIPRIGRVAAISPDGKTLAFPHIYTLQLWEMGAGQERAKTVPMPKFFIQSVAFSPDGKTLAVAGSVTNREVRSWGEVRLLDVATGRVRAAFEAGFAVTFVAFGRDGHTLVTGGRELWVWPLAPEVEIGTFARDSHVPVVAFSPDGRTLASAGAMGVRLTEVATCRELPPLHGHTDSVAAVAFSPDGKTLASAARDATLRLWDLGTGRERAVLPGDVAARPRLAFSPNGTMLATTWHVLVPNAGFVGEIKLREAATGRELAVLRGHRSVVTAVAFSPDGKTLASIGDDGTMRLWDVTVGRQRAVLRGPSRWGFAVAFSPDGKTLAAAWVTEVTQGKERGELQVWDATPGRERIALKWPVGFLEALAFSPDGTVLASAGRDRTVCLWDPATGRLRTSLSRGNSIACLAFSPDGRLLAAGNHGTVPGAITGRLWDVTRAFRPAVAPAVEKTKD